MEVLMIHNYSMKTLFVWWLVDLVVLVNNEPKVGMSRWDLITCKIGWYPGRNAMKLINWSVKWSDDGMMLGAAAFVCGVVILSQSPKWVLELSARYLQVWSNTENDRVHELFIFFTSNELKWDSKECNKFYLEEPKHCPRPWIGSDANYIRSIEFEPVILPSGWRWDWECNWLLDSHPELWHADSKKSRK